MSARQKPWRLVACLAPAACAAVVLGCCVLVGYGPVAAQQRATTSEPVLKVYACPPIAAEMIAGQLRQEYQGIPNIRIGADERLGQILVQAPPAIQSQIAERLTTPAPQVAQTPQTPVRQVSATTAQPPAATASQATASQTVAFQHSTARQMEAVLASVLGQRLTPLAGGTQSASDYRLALQNGGSVNLRLHYQANMATVQGAAAGVDSLVRLMQTLDSPRQANGNTVRAMTLTNATPASVQQVVDAVGGGGAFPGRLTGMAPGYDEPGVTEQPPLPNDAAPQGTGETEAPSTPDGAVPPEAGQDNASLIGPVQIQMITGLDVVVVQGAQQDVDRVMKIIAQIERLSAETEPVILVHVLQHVNCEAISELITPLYAEVYEPRQGTVSITALVTPNALLLVGRRDNLQTVLDLVNRLDRPVAPETEFQVFRLRYAAATAAQTAITEFFGQDYVGLMTRVVATVDYRSNALIVRAGPRDMLEVARLIERIDTPDSPAVNELRVFPLYNGLAADVATLLTTAIGGALADTTADPRSATLSFVTIDPQGQRRYNSAILSDVRIASDVAANTLLVTAPKESMELLDALIHELDKPPVAEMQIKVFTIVNGDAQSLTDMLTSLFTATTTGSAVPQTAALEGESALVGLTFVPDVRTNSIVASGSKGDLMVVDAILTAVGRERSAETGDGSLPPEERAGRGRGHRDQRLPHQRAKRSAGLGAEPLRSGSA